VLPCQLEGDRLGKGGVIADAEPGARPPYRQLPRHPTVGELGDDFVIRTLAASEQDGGLGTRDGDRT
jgi:hypothetical protein